MTPTEAAADMREKAKEIAEYERRNATDDIQQATAFRIRRGIGQLPIPTEVRVERWNLSLIEAMKIAEQGIKTWREKPHNAKWWRRIDGTPIPNDLMVNVAEAFSEALGPASALPTEAAEPGELERLRQELDKAHGDMDATMEGWDALCASSDKLEADLAHMKAELEEWKQKYAAICIGADPNASANAKEFRTAVERACDDAIGRYKHEAREAVTDLACMKEALGIARSALEPFAAAYEYVDDRVRGEGMMQPKRLLKAITVGDFRRADRAYTAIANALQEPQS